MENALKSSFKAQFNSLNINEADPTIIRGKAIIHGFEKSWNKQLITEEVCKENMSTLVGKRVVCRYIPPDENNGVDALTSHEETIGEDREGNPMPITETMAIGFIEDVYIDDYTDESGTTKRVLYGDIVLWNDDKYENVTGLLMEWLERGIKIHMSVEYLYKNYNRVDGVEYLQSPIIYVAHTFLNSEQRGDYAEILPAFDESQLTSLSLNDRKEWSKAVAQAIQNKDIQNQETDIDINNKTNNQKEDKGMAENVFMKALNELSSGEVRDKIMDALAKLMTADEYKYVWISTYGIYEDYFVYENYIEDEYKTFKIPYEKVEDDIVVKLDEKVEVKREVVLVEVAEMEKAVNEVKETLNAKEIEVEGLNESIKTLNSTVEALTSEKDEAIAKIDKATNSIADLTKQVNEMKPIVDAYDAEQLEKAVNAQKEKFEGKFIALNAKDLFESDEVQGLIKTSVFDSEEGKSAILSLNAKLVDLVMPIEKAPEKENKEIKEFNNRKMENLIVTKNKFEDRYFES